MINQEFIGKNTDLYHQQLQSIGNFNEIGNAYLCSAKTAFKFRWNITIKDFFFFMFSRMFDCDLSSKLSNFLQFMSRTHTRTFNNIKYKRIS